MTIYAIVNDLLNTSHEPALEQTSPVWTLISPAGILQGGNPYFVPDFDSRFEARLSLAMRIGKLGKGIARRFAGRYVEAVAPAVVFVATDLLQVLKTSGFPWASAISYDRCLALGKFTPMPYDEIDGCECSLEIYNTDSDDIITCKKESRVRLEEIIEAISRDNTLKTGDILLTGLSRTGPQVFPGQRATLKLNGEESMRFNIR
ncbi:MAG: fumarylacetoacetate hydrolase family protein [Muribaculaceae bacterium]|nr:fumarylacetoacetate hydrolase family protein [Muribaculaceae bacterium]